MILCHDMKGGYLQDKTPGGFDGLCIPDYVWPHISDFIYFSHNFVTIPSMIKTSLLNRGPTLLKLF